MKEYYCPNYKECRLVKAPDFKFSETTREAYLVKYCEDKESGWKKCKRFIAKSSLGFCPDFVLPDSDYSTDEIIDKFDNEI
jgi:hypothetical protein